VCQATDFCIKNALKLTYEHLEYEKKFPGAAPLDPQGGEEREGRGGEGRDVPPRQNPAYATDEYNINYTTTYTSYYWL
jgi:hypothetical protein